MSDVSITLTRTTLDFLYERGEMIRDNDYQAYREDEVGAEAWRNLLPKLRAAMFVGRGSRQKRPAALQVTRRQLEAIRDEIDDTGWTVSNAHRRGLSRVQNRINHFLRTGDWPKPVKSNPKWLPEVKAEAERIVHETVRHCCRVARRKEFELGLPSDWKPTVKISWSENRSRSRGGKGSRGLYGGHGGISIVLAHKVPKNGLGGGTFREYSHIEKEPVIGAFTTLDWRNTVRAVVAHEVAHAIQHWLRWYGKGNRRSDYDTPHGAGWQRLYALLRHEVVNPYLKAESSPAPVPPLPTAAKPVRKTAATKVAKPKPKARKKPVQKAVKRMLFTL